MHFMPLNRELGQTTIIDHVLLSTREFDQELKAGNSVSSQDLQHLAPAAEAMVAATKRH
jgi:hypothetical protein